jgi:aldose 1-epimerase
MSDFGHHPDGPVRRLTLSAGDLTVKVLTLGAILNDVRLRGGPGLTLGADRLEPYLGPMGFFGAVVGPVANRIAGAEVEIAGRRYPLVANEGGRTTLHGGPKGTHARLWTVTDAGPDHVTMTLDLPDGAEGYPGNRHLTARFRVLAPAMLEMELTATTDAPTLMNLANHSYWNLGPVPDLAGHRLQVAADRYTPVDAHLIPTGVAPVDGTPFDFRAGAPVGPGAATGLDHNFCLADMRGPLRLAARLTGPTGVSMTVETTEPGLQVYDAARQSPVDGHDGRPYAAHAGVAIEAQAWPDAPHQPDFPSIALTPGETYRQVTRWTFAAP